MPVEPPCEHGVVDVNERHDASRNRDRSPRSPSGYPVPSHFSVCVDDILCERQGHVVTNADGTLGLLDDIAAVSRMLSHLDHFVRRQPSWLVQHAIRHSHFTDIVQRRQAGQKLHALRRQVVSIVRVGSELRPARAPRVVSGVSDGRFRYRGSRSATEESAP